MAGLSSNHHNDYDTWNNALITYFTADMPRGTHIFLSIDDDGIAKLKAQLDATTPVIGFDHAVSSHVVANRKIWFRWIQGRNNDGQPKCVAFLTAMVIAASRMADEKAYAQTNYFIRLREVLGLANDTGRPLGMKAGEEEYLWTEWNNWLQEKGFLPSAKGGASNYDKYIQYPLSQVLLRRADRDRLCRLFREKSWNRDWDAETLGTYIRGESAYLPNHLHDVLHDAPRYQAVIADMHELYDDWRHGDCDMQGRRRTIERRNLSAGIYRTEDISGNVAYYLYPQSIRRQQTDNIRVSIANQDVTFRRERPGWYMPHYRLSGKHIDDGVTCGIVHPPHLNTLSLPQQPFWILIPDPDNPESGVYASWGRPQLGTPFIVLCRQELLTQLHHLRDERLIEWHNDPQPCCISKRWIEIRDCNIISQAWGGVEIANSDLYDKLCPRESLNITFSGGLRLSGKNEWLEACGPKVTVFGFQNEVDVVVKRASGSDEESFFEKTVPANEPFDVPWAGAGNYLVEIPNSGFERFVTIRPWEELERTQPDSFEKTLVNDWSICGALIEEVGEERQ